MFVTRRNLLSSVLFLSSLLVCCQLYPLQGGAEHLYPNYGMSLAKKDPSSALKDSLISALLMSDLSRGGAPNQRKKAVDSTFIRFGRSSMSEGNIKPPNLSQYEDARQQTGDLDYLSTSKKSTQDTMDNIVSKKISQNKLAPPFPPQYAILQDGCIIKNKNDLYMLLMGKICGKATPKVKRENVNDTFIRFGKRDIPSSLARAGGSDGEIKYER